MKINYTKYQLHFNRPAGTSRGVYKSRWVWFVIIEDNDVKGTGECAPLPGLSAETPQEVEQLLNEICKNPDRFLQNPALYQHISSVRFAIECALLDLHHGGRGLLFSNDFSKGKKAIPINGLIWMGNMDFMQKQIDEKLEAGNRCIKLKIGALNFDDELLLLQKIRKRHSAKDLTLRVDANGAFAPKDAMRKLDQLSKHGIHSIEQPIAPGQWCELEQICKKTPLPIALDEELIGLINRQDKQNLLEQIKPQYLVLKPSLHGGISGCDEWIKWANKYNTGWWITSYLESNVGLNAIAQWTFSKNVRMHQGLGTGQLFTNNIDSPLEVRGENLWYNTEKDFELSLLR